ncbi:MAG: hypothetical protein NDI61_12095 [Bdellovibrionaceae bacterium]|nr:hypothetical protein [Pseudobdellovibrionaceae bacterium]
MTDILQVADQYYVLATSVLADRETRVLKQGETFAIFDRYGDIRPFTHSEAGIFHGGTRFVSALSFTIAGDRRPVLLNSNLRDDNGLLKVEMTNPDLMIDGVGFVPKGQLHFHREKFLLDGFCHEQISVANFGNTAVRIPGRIHVAADFADVFEVRGMKRERRGSISQWATDHDTATLQYTGLDGIQRFTCLHFDGISYERHNDSLEFWIDVPPRGSTRFHFDLRFRADGDKQERKSHADGLTAIYRNHSAGRGKYSTIHTPNDQFDAWLRRSTDDLVMMTTQTASGFRYPYAGIPWFCAAFGRDGILTSLECLWANPTLARDTIGFLANTQATTNEPERDANPGKIIHEIRNGEMANLNEVPFGRYYGSVDSTPLFLALCGSYFRRTADLSFLRNHWSAIERALSWVDDYGDIDGDGFLEYASQTDRGLTHQGWKDSPDPIFHENGDDAVGPIALCEVQGYTYFAKRELSPLATALGHVELGQRLLKDAERLRERFNEMFWLEDLKTYALALDGQKRPCRVISSNAGQLLFTGIVPQDRAKHVANTLMSPTSFCGWGVRTLDSRSARYNPMSYHNGSVWPHDSALIAWGMTTCGLPVEAERIFEALFRASTYMEIERMPEVFCGFERKDGEAPTLYHHACAPQAWAAGAVYLLLASSLGLSIDATQMRICLRRPRLPSFLKVVYINDLIVGDGSIDLEMKNYGTDVSVQILRRKGDITLSVEK